MKLNELKELDYSSYNTALSEEQYNEYLNVYCTDYLANRVKMCRTYPIEANLPEYMLVDASKHEVRVSKGLSHQNIFLHTVSESPYWKNMPNKYRSLDFYFGDYYKIISKKFEYQLYRVIPFNGAILAQSEQLVGRRFTYLRPLYLLYLGIFGEEMNTDEPKNTIECIRRLGDAINNDEHLRVPKTIRIELPSLLTSLQGDEAVKYCKERGNYYKHEMKKDQIDLIDWINICCSPKKNSWKIYTKENWNLATGVGWTDSKLLLKKIGNINDNKV
jgi:hypothetical protein